MSKFFPSANEKKINRVVTKEIDFVKANEGGAFAMHFCRSETQKDKAKLHHNNMQKDYKKKNE